MKSIFEPILLTFSSKKYIIIAIILAVVMAFVSILVPSLLTPSNTLKLQLSLLEISEIILMILFSALFGIAIAMQIYASHEEKHINKLAKRTGTGLVAFTGTLFSAKLCPICLGAILGFFGIGGSVVFFLFSYKNEIMIFSILILIFIINITGRRITKLKICEKCC